MDKPQNDRLVAARLVAQWLHEGHFPDRLLEKSPDRTPFVQELVMGVIRWWRALDWICARLLQRPARDEWQACLLVGLYQMGFMDTVEDHAAVHETVAAARAVGGEHAARLANAVLRRFQREKNAWLGGLNQQAPPIRWSHPDVLWERWNRRWGCDGAQALCEWNNRRAETILRVNLRKTTVEAFGGLARAAGITVLPHPARPQDCCSLGRGTAVTRLPGFQEGLFFVQDPSTLCAPDLLAPMPGETILDACAAPGGKALYLAEKLAGQGVLVAVDGDAHRLHRLEQNLQRMQAAGIRSLHANAADPAGLGAALTAGNYPQQFDAVLLDAPCTNTGVLRRRVDARWRFSVKHLQDCVRQQHALLASVAATVKPGGRLVYSTCSLEEDENEKLVAAWLRENPAWRLEKSVCLSPPDSQTDGAFAARLIHS